MKRETRPRPFTIEVPVPVVRCDDCGVETSGEVERVEVEAWDHDIKFRTIEPSLSGWLTACRLTGDRGGSGAPPYLKLCPKCTHRRMGDLLERHKDRD